MTPLLVALALAALTAWLLWEDRQWNRRHPKHPDRPPAGLPTAGGSAGRSGAYPDEMAP